MLQEVFIVGAAQDGSMVIELENGSIGNVPVDEIGGNKKNNKAFNMIGGRTRVVEDGENYSRLKAMDIMQKEVGTLKVGQKINVTPIIIMEGFMVVEAFGHELYEKVKDISLNYISDLNDDFSLEDDIEVVVQSVNPLKISIKDAAEEKIKEGLKLYKGGRDWLGEVVANTDMGTFCRLPGNLQILCYPVKWARQPRKGDKVILEIKKIDYEEGKMWGAIKKFVKKVK